MRQKQGDSSCLKKAWWFDAVPEDYKFDKSGRPIKERVARKLRRRR